MGESLKQTNPWLFLEKKDGAIDRICFNTSADKNVDAGGIGQTICRTLPKHSFSSVFFSPIMYNIILYLHFIRPISIINQRQKFVYFLILVISKLFSLIT